jgi:nucleoid-associated protein YgaU
MLRFLLCMGVIALLISAGCGKVGVAEFEEKERGNALFSQAVTTEKSGDVDGAIKLYKQVMIDEPKAYSAHFMLATLLQDHSEDYIGAIYHYNRYIELQPKSEKVALARQRIKISEHLLAPRILMSVGDTAKGISQAHLLNQNTRLNGIIANMEGEKSKLLEQAQITDEMLKDLSAENDRLRKIVDKMRGDSIVDAPDSSVIERVKGEQSSEKYKKIRFSKTELDSLRREAAAMKVGESLEPVKKPMVKVPSVKSVLEKVQTRLTGDEVARKKAEADKAVREAAKEGDLSEFSLFKTLNGKKKVKTPVSERTYVVQPGDTLMRIATRFYGDPVKWNKIRNANRAEIDPDGRVRAGQIILIPR